MILSDIAAEADTLNKELGSAAKESYEQIADALILALAGREHEIPKNNKYGWVVKLVLGLSLEEARKLVSELKSNPRTTPGLANLDLRPPREYRW